ncbi:MAG: cysteine--tRNA ligase [Dehalococcoidia bacterium]|nr:cysteine--tRNA ligase [Dehalococcoidia bacterium]
MRLYNTLTGQTDQFVPSSGNQVKMYVCGVTPYSAAHVGHALSYVVFDVLRRYLEHLGYQVHHVQNFTDVDDKIIQRAKLAGVSENELVARYIDDFYRGMDAMNIQRAHDYPRATQEVPGIIQTIQTLVEKEFAYPAGGDVYFRVTKSQGYGHLSHRTLDGMMAGARVQVDENKEHPMDFVLWKGAKPGEPSWDSPWGPGRPGWHIECTTMSLNRLGDPLDIHGGGQDLVFPHHENEIAQSQAYTGRRPFARYWVHNGLLQLGEEKMSKSLGNLVTVEEALARNSADALRLYFLSSHYRGPLRYGDEGCAAAERGADRLRNALGLSDAVGAAWDCSPFQQQFFAAMDEDLNTPRAIATLFDLARAINHHHDDGLAIGEAQALLRRLGSLLGLTFQSRETGEQDHLAAKPFIDLLVATREDLRKAKQFALADHVRDGLASHGVVLEDTPQGTRWQRQTSAS